MNNIVEIVVNDKNLATLSKGVKAAGLESELQKNGPYTVFAPSDMAFSKLSGATLADLLRPENKLRLEHLLKNHVVAGETHLKDLKEGQKLRTLGGRELLVHRHDGKVMINGAALQDKDVSASNGVVLGIDSLFNLS